MFAYILAATQWVGKQARRFALHCQQRRLMKAKRSFKSAKRAIRQLQKYDDPDKPTPSGWTMAKDNWTLVKSGLGLVRFLFVLIVGVLPQPMRWLTVIVAVIGSLLNGDEPLPVI